MAVEGDPSVNKTDGNTFLEESGVYGLYPSGSIMEGMYAIAVEIDAENARGMMGLHSGQPKEKEPVTQEEK